MCFHGQRREMSSVEPTPSSINRRTAPVTGLVTVLLWRSGAAGNIATPRKPLEMTCCHGCVPQEVRPGTARVLVTELSGSGQINPTPVKKPCEDSETAVELYLSPEKLKLLCGTQDLCHITSLELCVDTEENTLGNFGAYLPKLVQLKMNNSMITSVRDLGTTLSHLQVLWMSRCRLTDLDGISTLSSLKELYVAYNNVSDLSQVCMLEKLHLLDLEGNDVDDLVQVQYLGLCGKLQTLTLEGNPVCVRPNPTATQVADYSYRASVRELVPQLRYLDDVRVEEDRLSCSSIMGEDWAILQNSIRDCNSSQSATEEEETADSACPPCRPSSARRPVSVWVGPLLSTGSRPHTSSRPISATRPVLSSTGSRPGSVDSDLAAVEADTSTLTHGAGKILFCGNPVQAIRARREKLRTAPTRSTFTPRDLPIHVPEHTYDLEDPDVRGRGDVFAELRAWRVQHSKRLQVIETERLPQVLAIKHSDEEEEEDDSGDEGFSVMRDDSSDEEHEVEMHDTTMSPSPPLGTIAPSGHLKPQGIRARRLRLSQATSEHLPDCSGVRCFPGTGTTARVTDRVLQRVEQVTTTNVPLLSQAAHIPRPPPTHSDGLMGSRVEMDVSSEQCGNKFRISKVWARSAITRPHTARAALQKHHQHHIIQPCRGSSQPD
ncbi:leucine-rich repeat-containing protein 56 isoform X2 [Anabas testudineus]|uniref:leucine-rich repeat-containing protein 56 isoform X2 n=1 Tax=Anabas testudineus TaxID=64144 RepID=UPI000E459E6C|nr:leucine-rich repeat-containing protein 56 isoform X2 [Anabas testudineus]